MLEEIYSPVHALKHPLRSNIVVKRDDLIDPYVSGNKWRKLKYTLAAADEQKKSHVVTFGGAYSNHLVATAAACARKGMKSTAFVRGEAVNNEMLMLCSLFGMQLIFTDRTSYREKKSLFIRHFGENQNAFFVDEGGAGETALPGCSEIIEELPAGIDHLFCAAGTGTTAAGLLRGIRRLGLKTKLHVVPVLKDGAFIRDEILKYNENSEAGLVLHTGYHFGGYAKTKPELMNYIKDFIATEGMLIDPVYTGKLFFAIDDLRASGAIPKAEKIMALHTGGILGIWGMKDKFMPGG